jgi:hypothetical protein
MERWEHYDDGGAGIGVRGVVARHGEGWMAPRSWSS